MKSIDTKALIAQIVASKEAQGLAAQVEDTEAHGTDSVDVLFNDPGRGTVGYLDWDWDAVMELERMEDGSLEGRTCVQPYVTGAPIMDLPQWVHIESYEDYEAAVAQMAKEAQELYMRTLSAA